MAMVKLVVIQEVMLLRKRLSRIYFLLTFYAPYSTRLNTCVKLVLPYLLYPTILYL